MTQITSKNHGHPTAKTLLEKLSFRTEYYSQYRLIDSQVIVDEEFKEDQYLYTKYIDELQRGFTKLNYDEWILEELQRAAQLRTFVHQEGIFVNKKERAIELLCSKKLSLLSHADNVESQIIEHYGDILYKNNNTSEAVEHWIKAKGMGISTDLLNKKISSKTYIEE